MLMQNQRQVSPSRGLPVDVMTGASVAVANSGETVQLYYNNSGTITADAGQDAGTVVVGFIAYDQILNLNGTSQGFYGDSSLSFTSTALTTEKGYVTFEDFEKYDALTWAQRMSVIGALLSNGEYVVDYRLGVVYGKKTSTTTTLTSVAYQVAGAPSVARYSSSDPSLSTGQGYSLRIDSLGNLRDTLATKLAGEDMTNDVMKSETQMSYTNITASALIKTGAGRLAGWVVNSANAGATIKFWDQTSAAVPVLLNTMTYTAAVNQGPTISTVPGAAAKFNTGLYCTISGTADVTILWS